MNTFSLVVSCNLDHYSYQCCLVLKWSGVGVGGGGCGVVSIMYASHSSDSAEIELLGYFPNICWTKNLITAGCDVPDNIMLHNVDFPTAVHPLRYQHISSVCWTKRIDVLIQVNQIINSIRLNILWRHKWQPHTVSS